MYNSNTISNFIVRLCIVLLTVTITIAVFSESSNGYIFERYAWFTQQTKNAMTHLTLSYCF